MNHAKMASALTARLRCFAANERGATAIEYGLIVSVISVALMGALSATSDGLKGTFQKVVDFFITITG